MVKCHQLDQDAGGEVAEPLPLLLLGGAGDADGDMDAGGGTASTHFRRDDPLPLPLPLPGPPQEPPDPLEALTTTSASSYSIYKQRIDSMFDETRSVLSFGYGTTGGPLPLPLPQRPPPPPSLHRLEAITKSNAQEQKSRKGANNVVQARIEKMFADMSNGGSTRNGGGVLAAIGCHRFSVDYLGSVPLADKVTTLRGLQQPLRDLYLGRGYLCRRSSGQGQGQGQREGFLEISSSGLRVHHSESSSGQLEQLNPFPTIAVWAAVQFLCRPRTQPGHTPGMECAFLPLIADPEGVDKEALFRSLSPSEERVLRASAAQPSGGGDCEEDDADGDAHHAPLFAVVMRKMGVSRQLECHGFVCSSEEDAIVMAANLYQALTASMKAGSSSAAHQEVGKGSGSGGRRRVARMHHENGIGRVSIAGSVCGDPSTDGGSVAAFGGSAESSCGNLLPEEHAKVPSEDSGGKPTPPKVPPPVPKRPPRKKKSSGSSAASDECEDLIILDDPSERLAVKASRQQSVATVSSLRGNFLSGDGRSRGSEGSRGAEDSGRGSAVTKPSEAEAGQHLSAGDILTKVAIPRSHSFLNANGPLTRYGRRQLRPGSEPESAGGGCRATSGARGGGGGGGSPLGFNELFTEFRQQEGLDSLDDILDAIIDAEGMSFNDLKPIYKEFLLKLALTLTKDELFQRSKSIMRRQRKKQMGRALGRSRASASKRGIVVTAGYIKRAVRRSISKLRPSNFTSRKRKLPLVDFSSLFQSASGVKNKKRSKKKAPLPLKSSIIGRIAPTSANSTSMSSYPSSNFRMSSKKPSISVVQGLDNACSVNVNVSINNSNNNRNNNINNHISNKARLPRRRSSRRRSHQQTVPLGTSTSEDSDFFTMIRCDSRAGAGSLSGGGGSGLSSGKGLAGAGRRGGHGSVKTTAGRSGGGGGNPNRSSSGYVSCSDCSYDSESCTCTSAERCYCSMGMRSDHHRHHAPRLHRQPQAAPAPATATAPGVPCGCDTDSCLGSDKCYCSWARCCHRTMQPPPPPHASKTHHSRRQRRASVAVGPTDDSSAGSTPVNIFEQLKQQGFAASDSSLSRAESPLTAWRNNESRVSAHAQQRHQRKQRASSSVGSMRSSRSLEFLQVRPLLPQHQYPAAVQQPQHLYCSRMDVYRADEQEHHRYSGSRSLLRHNARLLGRPPSRTGCRAQDEELLLGDGTGTRRSRQQRKVLVVSARDPKGRVIYMGASCREDLGLGLTGQFFPRASLSGRQPRRHHHPPLSAKPSSDPADEALSVKKSAEIAALFTNVKVSQTTDIVARSTDVTDSSTTAGEDMIYSSLDGQPVGAPASRHRQGMYLSGTSLENSLGYLP